VRRCLIGPENRTAPSRWGDGDFAATVRWLLLTYALTEMGEWLRISWLKLLARRIYDNPESHIPSSIFTGAKFD